MFCSKCGTNNPDGAAFCAGCGAPLTTVQQPVQQQYAQPVQQQYAQPDHSAQQQYVQPTYAGQYGTAPQQPKKKSRKGLIIGAACGGAAVITAGTLVLTLGQASIMRSVMGDVEYAKSVNTRFLSDNFSLYTGVARSAASTSSNMLAPAKNMLSSSSLLTKNGSYSSTAGIYSSDYSEDIGDNAANGDNGQQNDVHSKYSESTVQAASTVYMLADIIESVSKDGVTVSTGLTAELGSKLTELIPADYNDIVDDIKTIISTSEMSISATRKDGALAYSLYFKRNGSNFIGAVIQITEDGQLTIAFPEATKRAITLKMPSAEELGLKDTFSTDTEPLISEKDIERLVDEIAKAYLSCYEYADISYTDGEVDIDGNSTGCTVITATFDSYNIGMIIGKVTDVIQQDESVAKALDKLGGKDSIDGIIDSLRGMESQFKEDQSSDLKLVIESYVNSANQPLGVKFTLGNEYSNYTFISVDSGSYGRMALETNGSTMLEVVNRKDGSTSGKAVFSVYPYATGSGYGDAADSISVNIDYRDMKTFKAFGQENLGGTYTVSIADTPYLEKALSSASSGGMDVYGIITGLSVTVSMKEYNGGIEESAGLAVEEYGSLSVTARAVPKADIPALPNDIILIDIEGEDNSDELQALTEDILNYCSKQFETDGQLKKLDEDFERISGQKFSSIFGSSMKGYTEKSKVTSANSTAAIIKSCIDTELTNFDTMGCGMNMRDSKCLVTGIIDGNGKWELMLTDVNGFKAQGDYKWENSATATANESKSGVTSLTKTMAIDLANWFPELKSCCFEAYLTKGRCVAIWYTPSTDSPSTVSGLYGGALIDEYGWKDNSYSWNGITAGITNEGYVVGTAPMLYLG